MSYILVGFIDGGDSVLLITLLGPGVPVTFQLFESGLQCMDSYLYRQSCAFLTSFPLLLGVVQWLSSRYRVLHHLQIGDTRRCRKPSHTVSSVVMVPTEKVCKGFPSSGLERASFEGCETSIHRAEAPFHCYCLCMNL